MSDFLDVIADRKLTYDEIQRVLVHILSLESESMLIGETMNIWNSYNGHVVVCVYEYTLGDFPTIIEVEFLNSLFQGDIIDAITQFCEELDCTVLAKDPNLSQLKLPPKFTYQFINTYLLVTSDGRFKYVKVDEEALYNNKIFKIIE